MYDMDRNNCTNAPDTDDDFDDETTPLVAAKPDRADRLKLLDCLLDKTGYGAFHVVLLIVMGLALASDSVEVTCISFVTPVLEENKTNPLYPTKVQEGALDSVIFIGMMFGGYIWGSWADIAGRRISLISSLTINGLFGVASSMSPSYAWFMVFRFGGGVGVGGSIPVVFSYISEFFSETYKGAVIIILASFWTLGRVYASLFAWLIVPREHEIGGHLGTLEFTSWRAYILVCTVPCFSAALALVFLPESPGFLLVKHKYKSLMKVLHRIHFYRHCGTKSGSSFDNVIMKYLDDINSAGQLESVTSMKDKLRGWIKANFDLFIPPYLRISLVMLLVNFTLAFGYYGLMLWFPEYFKRIQEKNNNTNSSNESDSSVSSQVYLDSLYVGLATIPGLIVGLIVIRLIGSKLLLTVSMVLSGVSTFLIWCFPSTTDSIVILTCIFAGISTAGWNALDVITPELFPVYLRSTAFGIQAGAGRIGAIIGLLAFGKLIDFNQYLPILIVAVLLVVGGLAVYLLPCNLANGVLIDRLCAVRKRAKRKFVNGDFLEKNK